MNKDPSSSKVSVLKIEKLNINNGQVIPLHILDSDVGTEMLIPHIYITEGPLSQIIGLEKPVISTMKQIPMTTDNGSTIYTQFSNKQIPMSTENSPTTYTQLSNKFVTATKPLGPVKSSKTTYNYNQNQQYTDVIPESSKRSAINEQIELYPLSYVNNSSIKEDDFHSIINSVKTNTDLFINELNSSCIPDSIKHEEEPVLLGSNFTKIQANPSPLLRPSKKSLNENIKPVKENTVPEILPTNRPTVKRKVQNYIHISDVKAPQRAVAVLPTALLLRGKTNIFPKRTLPMRIRFGPVEGVPTVITSSEAQVLVTNTESPVFLIKKDDKIIQLSVSDKDKCNWMGLLPLGEPNDANLWLYQDEDELYAMTTEPINARKQLKLGYSKNYAEQHKLPPGSPTLDLDAVLSSNPKQWWCNECNRALASAPLLQRHADVYHKDDVIATRRGYRCVHCRRLYSRLYTLRRHLAKNCTKKLEKPVEISETQPIYLNSSMNEDHRLPSDESFQNFTNGLDFSTSLFDTDRISNIDISGNSRADDFNPYGISFRDDTCTSNDLSFAKFGHLSNTNEEKTESASQRPTRQCNRLARKQNKLKYINDYPSRSLDCACGRSFRSSQKLSQHYLREHSGDNDVQTNLTSSPENIKYTCEQCKTKRVSFKRRGMLVNHLWRAHKVVSTLKVERPVRHYPCVSCSKVYRSAAKRDKHIKVHHPDKCNWMGLLPLGEPNDANLWLYQDEDELYAMTTEPINARKQLKLGYSKNYVEQHKLPPGSPTLDLDAVLSSNPKQWWCNECNRALASAPLLQRHADVYHKDDVIATRRGYRCVHCRRLYSRLYTLRRHLAKNCTKKLEKPVEISETQPIYLNSSMNEDNRLPSDESFQNFTNGLDFSTSLFDTDRISNIDISGNSRADDFNPYGISFRDDTCTSNDLSFAKFGHLSNTNEEKTESASQRPTRQCNRLARKQNKLKYLNDYPSRSLDCACGRSFRSSQKLSQHYLREHSGENDVQTNLTSSPENIKYTCEQCKTKRVSFKRRGMLVNHLWRAHKVVSTLKVERPVRHYPCVSCSKVYRSAAKRDKHIKVHHPGAEKLLKSSIPGGVRSCDAAVCSQCPRQYATRAKLLQHMRAAHPHIQPHT